MILFFMLQHQKQLRCELSGGVNGAEHQHIECHIAASEHPAHRLLNGTAEHSAAAGNDLLIIQYFFNIFPLFLFAQRTARRVKVGDAGKYALDEHIAAARIVLGSKEFT